MKRVLSNICTALRGSLLVLIITLFAVACSNNKEELSKSKFTVHEIDSLNNLLAKQTNEGVEALKQVDSLFKLSNALGYEKGIVESASQKIRRLREYYKYDVALQFIMENTQVLNDFHDPFYQAMMNEQIGLLYRDLDDFDQAFNYFSLALDYYANNNKLERESYVLSCIGLMFIRNDVDKSKEYLQKSLDISQEIYDSVGIARELNNIAIIYNRLNNYDTARMYYIQALHINERIGKWSYYATNLFNLANIEKKKNNFNESIKLYTQTLQAFDTLNERYKYAQILLNFGDVYYNMNDFDKAITYFAAADSLGEKYSWLSIQKDGNWGLYHCYKSLDYSKNTIKHLEKYLEIQDLLQTKRNIQELTRLELQYKNDQLIKQKSWKQQKQKIILYFALVLLLFFLAFSYQLFKKQKIKADKEKLERLVLENELEGKERELTSFVLNMIRLNEKKLGIITYLKKQKPRLKMENRDVIDTAIHDLEYDQDARVWEEFEMRFNKVNSDFYQRLTARFPNLTLNEKRLCAFLLMNMTTKEISSITGQSTTAIGKARTRLRKKLNLTNQDESITSVLNSL